MKNLVHEIDYGPTIRAHELCRAGAWVNGKHWSVMNPVDLVINRVFYALQNHVQAWSNHEQSFPRAPS